ncbi:MAG: hypothetical protein KZQ66_04300 [Candidatus Thiodiazotropha sp. (ex Lucinoma aequizonata)]|nr:hypothetical protein [Candidatus Thiodiazotropha sp. (ex Lucinoma aequizonata)]MCU7900094.1 hypothetical protein [Candidatus Thiodiazotropha sp. (ex Lucinoma aequizonata)]MCU7901313.1 hypothetical protein [Candidatus Thiodiazotropha sp. (ex Lucinoma aequizonata)]
MIEGALRKLAIEGGGISLNGKSYGVRFTLRQLQSLLKSQGHGYAVVQIKEGLRILSRTVLEVRTAGFHSKDSWSATILTDLRMTNRVEYLSGGDDVLCYAEFHPMVRQSISDGTYRLHDFNIHLSISSPTARYIYVRLCQYWRQAGPKHDKLYTPNLRTFIGQTPYNGRDYVPDQKRAFNNALDKLIKAKVLSHYVE